MTGTDTAIRRLAFAQARSSAVEAMIGIAVTRQELQRATSTDGVTEEQEAARFADRARQLQASGPAAAPMVDKTA